MIVVASAARRARYWLTVRPARSLLGGQESLERDRRRRLAGANELRRQLVNILMDRFEEVPRLEEIADAVKRLIVDEYRAEQRLLGLDIVRCSG